jgi:hypothetical protein
MALNPNQPAQTGSLLDGELDFAADVTTTQATCLGQKYRFIKSAFRGKGGRIVFTSELRLLKRASCPGCEVCGPALDALDELIDIDFDKAIIFDDLLESGAIVVLELVIDSRDYETGHVEEYHFKAIEQPKEEKPA